MNKCMNWEKKVYVVCNGEMFQGNDMIMNKHGN